ncbi:uncharacterized protein N0V89_007899 [Didymosphaeria variabile]|uniref:Uncharacterized protein n=1 Tax=Didymosphaeria variabile TaxID=1932322 RepID=A0A9W8XME1_9PLEO|nr:uncharacterized protein N0V89_007899 [Didymosphaeria variabile]KAJ4352550.1 hypothetical protein N0V89_007899 [Didymosphaeria variabile]
MTALFGATVSAVNHQNVFNIYDSTDCTGDPIGSFTGDTTYDSNFVTNYSGRVGSIIFSEVSAYAGELNDGTDCIITGTICCAYAPTCRINEYASFVTCTSIDMDVDGKKVAESE